MRLGLPFRHGLGASFGAQFRQLLRLEAEQLGEHRLGVLAERRGGAADLRLAPGVQADGRDRPPRGAPARVPHVHPEAAPPPMRLLPPPPPPPHPPPPPLPPLH